MVPLPRPQAVDWRAIWARFDKWCEQQDHLCWGQQKEKIAALTKSKNIDWNLLWLDFEQWLTTLDKSASWKLQISKIEELFQDTRYKQKTPALPTPVTAGPTLEQVTSRYASFKGLIKPLVQRSKEDEDA